MNLAPGALLTIAQARELLPVSAEHLRALCRAGTLRAFLVGAPGSRRGRWLVSRESLEDFVAGELNQTPPPPSNAVTLDQLADRARRGA